MLKRGYQELQVWQKAMELVDVVYAISASFPDTERYGLIAQIRKSAVSVPSNIAEGATRSHTKEFIRFVDIARGSLAELETQMMIATRQKFVTIAMLEGKFDSLAVETGRMLNGLQNSLKLKLNTTAVEAA